MGHYGQARSLKLAGNDGAVLRWNACARYLDRHPALKRARQASPEEQMLE
jgi:hypothetical protein